MKIFREKVHSLSPESYRENLASRCEISDMANKILESPEFIVSTADREIKIGMISVGGVGGLGFPDGGRYDDIMSSIWWKPFFECPKETAVAVCVQKIIPPPKVRAITFISKAMRVRGYVTAFVFEVQWYKDKKPLLTCTPSMRSAFLKADAMLGFVYP